MGRVTVEMPTAMFENCYLPAIRNRMHEELEPALRRVTEEIMQKVMAEVVVDITQNRLADVLMDRTILGVEFRWAKNRTAENKPG